MMSLLAFALIAGAASAGDEPAARPMSPNDVFAGLDAFDHPPRRPLVAPSHSSMTRRSTAAGSRFRRRCGRRSIAPRGTRRATSNPPTGRNGARIAEARRQLDAAAGRPFTHDAGLRPAFGPLKPALR